MLEDAERAADDGELDREALDATEGAEQGSRQGPAGRGGPGGGRRTLAEELYLTEGAILTLVADRSVFIRNSIDEVRNAGDYDERVTEIWDRAWQRVQEAIS